MSRAARRSSEELEELMPKEEKILLSIPQHLHPYYDAQELTSAGGWSFGRPRHAGGSGSGTYPRCFGSPRPLGGQSPGRVDMELRGSVGLDQKKASHRKVLPPNRRTPDSWRAHLRTERQKDQDTEFRAAPHSTASQSVSVFPVQR